jgi:hypothetical protein
VPWPRSTRAGAAAGPVRPERVRFRQDGGFERRDPASGSVPDGFENTPGVVVRKGSTAADLPGKINFDIDPDAPKPASATR